MNELESRHAEETLRTVLLARQTEFGDAIRLVEQLQGLPNSTDARISPLLNSLRQTLARTVESETTMQAAADAVRQSGRFPALFQGVVAEQEQLLKTLIAKIQELTQRFQAERNLLTPLLDHGSRRRQVHRAYQASFNQNAYP